MSHGKRPCLIGQGNEKAMIRLVLVLIHISGGHPFIDALAGLLSLLGYESIKQFPSTRNLRALFQAFDISICCFNFCVQR